MDVKDFRYVIAVYETKSFSRAANILGTVQSNVSLRVRNVERAYGVTLFERKYRHVAPTNHGETLYHHAKGVLALIDRAAQAIASSRPA